MLEKLLGGRYKVIYVLGSGGFGQTYVAEDIQRPGNPKCVVKHFKPANQDPDFLEVGRRLFLTEAATLEKLGRHDQIPRLLAYFEEEQEFYLVQELIEGHSLSAELLPGKQLSESYAIELLEEVLNILQYVHAQGVIHRDIKPNNLIRRHSDRKLVLIDFGAVKAIETQIAAEPKDRIDITVGIGTQGYMPNEQLAGKPRFNSDIYALGMIGIKALTGIKPSELPQTAKSQEISWRDLAQTSDELAAILNKMVRYHFSDRYQSATEVLEAIAQIKGSNTATFLTRTQPLLSFPRNRKLFVSAGAVTIASLAIYLLAINGRLPSIVPILPSFSKINFDTNPTDRNISFGDKILNYYQENKIKKEGIDLISAGAYEQAITALEKARQMNPSDPEILIYLNNARIGKGKAYAIAISVPLGDAPDSALEMLRGVAQAQNEINSSGGINKLPLKVAIANDDNKTKLAKAIAKRLVQNEEILGVVGHGISDTSQAAGSIYESGRLVAISPISSAVQLSRFGGYVFRTMPSDRFTARALTNYMLANLKKEKAAVFFNSASVYSQSLKNEFKNSFFYLGRGKLVGEFDMAKSNFNAKLSVDLAIKKGAEIIALFPTNDVSDRALLVVKINRKRLKMISGDGFYTPKTLEIGGEEAEGMVLAIPGEIAGDRGWQFRAAAKQLWGQEVNWRTALAYDSARALIAAIRKKPTREGVQTALSSPDFSVAGVTGNVSFRDTGDREAPVQLVMVTPIAPGKPENGYKFKPLP